MQFDLLIFCDAEKTRSRKAFVDTQYPCIFVQQNDDLRRPPGTR
jgi:hypothetical protein